MQIWQTIDTAVKLNKQLMGCDAQLAFEGNCSGGIAWRNVRRGFSEGKCLGFVQCDFLGRIFHEENIWGNSVSGNVQGEMTRGFENVFWGGFYTEECTGRMFTGIVWGGCLDLRAGLQVYISAVMICANQVNTHTHRQTDRETAFDWWYTMSSASRAKKEYNLPAKTSAVSTNAM